MTLDDVLNALCTEHSAKVVAQKADISESKLSRVRSGDEGLKTSQWDALLSGFGYTVDRADQHMNLLISAVTMAEELKRRL